MKEATITENIYYIGVDDTDIDLFESQYPVPDGISYNSYLIMDDRIAIMDTIPLLLYKTIIRFNRAIPKRKNNIFSIVNNSNFTIEIAIF